MRHFKYLKNYKTYESNDYMSKRYNYDEHPLNETLINLFNKYNSNNDINWDDLPYLKESDILDSLKLINGDGEIESGDHMSPRYTEHFGDLVLIVFAYAGGLTGKYTYKYEIKVVKKSSKSVSQIGGGYGTSGFDFATYDTPALIISENCPTIVDKEVISKVINDFREVLNDIHRKGEY
jgi:hypothetical protein